MLKLGTQLEKKSVIIKVYKFDLTYMEWSLIPSEAEFMVSEKPFASLRDLNIQHGLSRNTPIRPRPRKYLKI